MRRTETEEIITALREGLFACSNLHNLELRGEVAIDPDDETSSPEWWLMLVKIVCLVKEDTLRHITVRLEVPDNDYPCPWLRPWVDWRAFREACERFVDLSSITLAFTPRQEVVYWKEGEADYIFSRMRGFHDKGLLYLEHASPDPLCSQKGCRWYK